MKPSTQKRSLAFGLGLLLLLAGFSFLAPWLPLPEPESQALHRSLEAPAWWQNPILGTDLKGRDILSRTLAGARVSMAVGLWGTLLALFVGVPYGAVAGLFGGRIDRRMMRVADFFESLPLVVVVLFLLSIVQEYRAEMAAFGLQRIHLFYLAVGALFWLPTARVARAESLRLSQAPFVQAARAQGASRAWILRRHLLPNLAPSVLVMMSLTVPRVVLMEAFLSFLGLGVEPPAVSWGLLAAEGLAALSPLLGCWWVLVVPATAMALSLFALNLVGDCLRDRMQS
ncbi:MAG: ABC transporter permease [Planctomycetota bacterium]|nr:MAG: ABC transporter permease [Planctomycetota bacterium]